jgi:hypothetical protein
MYLLRKALPATQPPSLLIDGEKIALNPEVVDIDAAIFEQLLTEGTPAALERAVALYRGDFLDGLSVNEAYGCSAVPRSTAKLSAGKLARDLRPISSPPGPVSNAPVSDATDVPAWQAGGRNAKWCPEAHYRWRCRKGKPRRKCRPV